MSRKETLQNEHNARVVNKRIDSALPPRGACGTRNRQGLLWIVLVVVIVAAAGVAGWLVYGGRVA
jgi:hypothetical protein